MKTSKINSDLIFDSRKLRLKIKDRYGTIGLFAKALSLSPTGLSNKLRTGNFTLGEMLRIRELLDIPHKEMADYFLVAYATGESPEFIDQLDTYDTNDLVAALERRSSVISVSVPTEDKLQPFLDNLKSATVLIISKGPNASDIKETHAI